VIGEALAEGANEIGLALAICRVEEEVRQAHLSRLIDQLKSGAVSIQPTLAGRLLRFRAFLLEWLQSTKARGENRILSKIADEISRLSEALPEFEYGLVEEYQTSSAELFECLYTLAYPVCGSDPFPVDASQDRILGLVEIEADAMLNAQLELQRLGPASANSLHNYLSDPDPLLRRACVWLFSGLASGRIATSLRSVLADDDIFVRGAAALVISNASGNRRATRT
jgi:hypothetical protein